jgi:hypothetical protein
MNGFTVFGSRFLFFMAHSRISSATWGEWCTSFHQGRRFEAFFHEPHPRPTEGADPQQLFDRSSEGRLCAASKRQGATGDASFSV